MSGGGITKTKGKSAYQLWLEEGNNGTVEEFLDDIGNVLTVDETNAIQEANNPASGNTFVTQNDLSDTESHLYWEVDLESVATDEHPRWDDSGDEDVYGRDKFELRVLPSGLRSNTGNFSDIGSTSGWWSATESDTDSAYDQLIYYNASDITEQSASKEIGLSIRLVRPYTSSDGDQIDGNKISTAFTDPDGNEYEGVIIGDQVWLTENLKTTKYNNGDDIPTGLTDTEWEDTTDGAYAVYDYDGVSGIDSESEMIEAYGLLYNWYAVDDSRGLGDSDWHVPSDTEFTELTDYITNNYSDITEDNVGNYLKSVRQVNSPYIDSRLRPRVNSSDVRRKILGKDVEGWDAFSWNKAHSWGNHADEGYLKDETDPVYSSDITVQSLSGTSVTLNANDGHNATITLSDDTTITFSNLSAGNTGNITVTNPSTAYDITLDGYTFKISPSLSSSSGVITMSGNDEVDVLSWYYDGNVVIINGTLAYD